MRSKIGICAAILFLSQSGLRADVQALPISIAVVFEQGNGEDEGWWDGFRSSFGSQVVVKDFRGENAWSRALAIKPALVLLQANTQESDKIRQRIGDATGRGAIPVLVIGSVRAKALRDLAAS